MISVVCVFNLFGSKRTLAMAVNVNDEVGRDLNRTWFDVPQMLRHHEVLWYAY